MWSRHPFSWTPPAAPGALDRQSDAKAQFYIRKSSHFLRKPRTPDNSRSPTRGGPHMRHAGPSYGRTHHVAKLLGTLVRRASLLMKGPPMSLGPELPRALGAPHFFSFPDLSAGEEENRVKEHRVPWTIHCGESDPGPIVCLPST